jgi:hypothetical protein
VSSPSSWGLVALLGVVLGLLCSLVFGSVLGVVLALGEAVFLSAEAEALGDAVGVVVGFLVFSLLPLLPFLVPEVFCPDSPASADLLPEELPAGGTVVALTEGVTVAEGVVVVLVPVLQATRVVLKPRPSNRLIMSCWLRRIAGECMFVLFMYLDINTYS